jgi:Ca2+-binding RTX toxin-like protein
LSGPPVSPFGLAPFSGIEAVTVDLDGGSDTLSYAGTTTPVSATVGGAVTGFPGLILGLENLTGGSGNDFLVGDSMDNVLTGGLGNDVLTGGPGNDTFNYTIGDGADTIESVDLQAGGIDTLAITGTGGNDTLDVVWLGSNVGLGTIQQFAGGGTANVDVITLDLGGGNDTLSYAGTFPDIVVQLGVIASGFGGGAILGVENVTAGSGNDILIGDENANVLIGGLGNDTLNGGAGGDTFFYTMGDGADSVDGGAGTDQLMISGTGGNDTLNLIWSGTEISQVAGGAVTGIESAWLDLGAGTDTVSYAGSTADVSAFLGVNASGFPFTFAGVENITGGSGNDNLGGDGNANVLIGGSGDDGLIGGGGNDLLLGGDGNDSLGGWGGNDTLIGGAGNDYMVGDLTGEAGDDTFVYVVGDGADSIDGGLGTDTLAITGTGFPNETLAVVWSGSGMISQLAGGTVSNVEIVTLNFAGDEPGDTLSYAGSTQGISVNLQAGSATGFTSIAGVENVIGGSGNDSLTGDNNANVLIGGDGNDILVGGFGSDMLTGSAGADTFVFSSTADSSATLALSDVITDFVHGTDKIDLSAIDAVAGGADDAFVFAGNNSNTFANSVTWSESGSNTIIHINNTGNTGPDMQIIMTGIGLGLTSTDFNL